MSKKPDLMEVSERLRRIRMNQPKATLEEARDQAKRVMAAIKFKPSVKDRKIAFASEEQVSRASIKIDKEFSSAFKILSD